MKKIQFKSLSWTEAGLLRASLRRQLIAQHPDIREMGGQMLTCSGLAPQRALYERCAGARR